MLYCILENSVPKFDLEMANERWKYVVFNKNITEEESLDFYTTWAKDVKQSYNKRLHLDFFSIL